MYAARGDAHVDHLLRALLERELGPLRPSTLSCRCRRDLRAITSDAYNGWAGPVAADRRAPSHPGQHGHIALFTAKADALSQSVVEKEPRAGWIYLRYDLSI